MSDGTISNDGAAEFLAFVTCQGNVAKTAAVCGCSRSEIARMCDELGWVAKHESLTEGWNKEGVTPEDALRDMQRLKAAVHAQRILSLVGSQLEYLEGLSDAERIQYLFETKPNGGTTPTMKLYVEAAKALEIATSCLYRSTGDQLPMRPDSPDEEKQAKDLNLSVGQAMQKAFTRPAAMPAPAMN